MSQQKLHQIEDMESLYAAQKKIYSREVNGPFQTLRKWAVWILLGLFYLVAWIPWGDRQAVLFDLPARQFHVFGLTFWPQDFIFLAWLLILLWELYKYFSSGLCVEKRFSYVVNHHHLSCVAGCTH